MNHFYRLLVVWFPLAIVATLLSAVVYLAVQHTIRMDGNDPQIQLARDASLLRQQGVAPSSVVVSHNTTTPGATGPVNVAESLAPFTIIYDAKRNVLASGMQLDGQVPALPSGVFNYVAAHGEDRFTWQPQSGVRIAAVVVPVADNGGFVLAGRSLAEVDNRENQLTEVIMGGWVMTVVGTFLVAAWSQYTVKSSR